MIRALRKAGPKLSASIMQEKLGLVLDQWHLSKLNRIGNEVMRHVLGDPMAIESDGFRIEAPFDSRWMLARMKIESWEPFQLALFKSELRSGMTVLDIGANIGFYSLTASRGVGNRGSVYAFEADPRNILHLRANIIANRCTNITVVDRAVGEGPATHIFRMAERPTHSSLFTSMGDMPVIATVSVKTVAVDDVFADNPTVHVIKMDIEGGEAAALRGMATTLSASPDLRMFVEYEPLALEAAGESPEEFLSRVKSLFDDISVIDERDRRLVPLGQATLTSSQSLYCVRTKSG